MRAPFENHIKPNEKKAVTQIAELVDEGHFDFTKLSKGIFSGWFLLSGWLAYESAKLYFKIGADGTKYLAPSYFFKNKKQLGKQSAFCCNFSLNWYFMMTTALEIREAYLNYQARKKLGLPYTKKELIKIGIKFSLAIIMAGTTGTLFALIAGKDSKQPIYNQAITGAVNTLLNFIGSMALQDSISMTWNALKDFFSETENIEKNLATERVQSHIQKNLIQLHRKTNEDPFWISNTKATDIAQHLLNASETTALLTSNTQNKKNILTPSNIVYSAVWLGMQYCNIIGLLGWYVDTVENIGELFDIGKYSPGAWTLGTLFFSTFTFLALKLVQDTINETTELGYAISDNTAYIKKNPSVIKSKPFWKAATINLLATSLTLGGYFLGYVSSNSSLDLNASHGFKQPWNIYPTCISTTAFNGFAFLLAFIGAAALAKKYIVNSQEKRNALDKSQKIYRFIEGNSNIIDKLSEETTTGWDLQTTKAALV